MRNKRGLNVDINYNDKILLLDKFKEHNWFLPASGDAIRIMYYLSKTEGEDAIFKNAKDAGKFIEEAKANAEDE